MPQVGIPTSLPPPKVSEHATWSALVYQRVIDAALAAAGAPPDLVRIVTGFGEAGGALVTGGVDKLIFVGSTAIGHKVELRGGAEVPRFRDKLAALVILLCVCRGAGCRPYHSLRCWRRRPPP